MTLVELLAVVVILSIIGLIAVMSIGKIISNSKADAHLANARQVLGAGKLAYASGYMPEHEFHTADNYTMQDLIDQGLLNDKIKNPSVHFWKDANEQYHTVESIVVVDTRNNEHIYKVNLSIGGYNYLFNEPQILDGIKRESFTDKFKEELNLK